MRLLVLLGLICAASAALYEPAEDDWCCTVCSDPVVDTFDRLLLMITEAQKTAIAIWGLDTIDGCRFAVHAVTSDDVFGATPNPDRPWLDWIGIGFHVRMNLFGDAFRNWVFGQHCNKILERGQGFKPTVRKLPWEFPIPGTDDPTNTKVWRPLPCPESDWPVYIAEERTNPKGDPPCFIAFRSNCCPWALDWYPNLEKTCLRIWLKRGSRYEDPYTTWDSSTSYETTGICGNTNGDAQDDWKGCDGGGVEPNFAGVSAGCFNSDHDGQAFQGGARF